MFNRIANLMNRPPTSGPPPAETADSDPKMETEAADPKPAVSAADEQPDTGEPSGETAPSGDTAPTKLSGFQDRCLTNLRQLAQTTARQQVELRLAELGTRITPAIHRTGISEALTVLQAAETELPRELAVNLAAASGTTVSAVSEVVYRLLEHLPENPVMTTAELAGDEAEKAAARCSGPGSQILAEHGLDDERLAVLRKKYGFGQPDDEEEDD